jgi:hypothetical protein
MRQTRSATNGKMKNCVATMVYHLFILMPFNFLTFNGYVEQQYYGIHKTVIHKLVYQEITTHTHTHTHICKIRMHVMMFSFQAHKIISLLVGI